MPTWRNGRRRCIPSAEGHVEDSVHDEAPGAHGHLASTKSGGRLIYYSGDVRPGGQFLNFSALPIYGPISNAGAR
jgi:hypothetical protein